MMVYLIADESGAKGYHNRSESYLGETGVFAGYLVSKALLEELKSELAKVASQYFRDSSKYHISDLQDSSKQALRTDVFQVLANYGVTCVYEAIHVEGFKAEHDRIEAIKNDASAARKSPVRISRNRSKESLHQELFQGLFAKAVAYCIDTYGQNYHLIILTDRLDRPIFAGLGKTAKELLNFEPSRKHVSAWDPDSREVVTGTITTTVEIPTSYGMDEIASASYEFQMDEQNSPLVLGADILANSINYIFRSRPAEDVGNPLNDRNAIGVHALFSQFYGFLENEEGVCFSDVVYSYPSKTGGST